MREMCYVEDGESMDNLGEKEGEGLFISHTILTEVFGPKPIV